jgi:hypothetical protein
MREAYSSMVLFFPRLLLGRLDFREALPESDSSLATAAFFPACPLRLRALMSGEVGRLVCRLAFPSGWRWVRWAWVLNCWALVDMGKLLGKRS